MTKNVFLLIILLSLIIIFTIQFNQIQQALPVYSSNNMISINEIMISNKSTLMDFDGQSSDWIEIVNKGDAVINLEGYGLSDNLTEPEKWVFPYYEIQPNEFLVVFASGKDTVNNNQIHTNFKLNSKGERLFFIDPSGHVIEEINVPENGYDLSYGRSFDSSNTWIQFQQPTPGFQNSDAGVEAFNASKMMESPSLYISEFMAENISFMKDEFGDYPDWVEIYNCSDENILLSDYFLSDDESNPFLWQFPNIVLEPGGYRVVFCSGKNSSIATKNLHTNFKINKKDETILLTNYLGKIADLVVINNLAGDSSYVRQSVDVWEQSKQPTPGYPNSKEGYEKFLETKEIAGSFFIYEAMSRNENTLADENGIYHDWIEIRNTTESIQNLEGYMLTDECDCFDKWTFPSCIVQPYETAIVFLSKEYSGFTGQDYLYADFGLSANGDVLFFSDPKGNIIQRLDIPELPADISYGYIDNAFQPCFFTNPTPNHHNDAKNTCVGRCDSPDFSDSGGFYPSGLLLSLFSNDDNAIVCYTTDGSEPGPDSLKYTQPIEINSTTVISTCAYKEGNLSSKVMTNTYFVEPINGFATTSVTTNPQNLWDVDTGIYVMGENAEEEYPYKGANFWQEWEKSAHVEFYETDGSLAFSMDAGLSIHGEYTRAADQKSFGIDARKKYGNEYIDYCVFPEKDLHKYQSIVLRNSGQDNGNTKIRDVLITQLMKDTKIDYQAYRPVVMYLNGEYWGLYTLRESTDRHFLSFNNGLPNPDNLDIIEGNNRVHQGDFSNFKSLLEYINNHDLSIDENYEHVKTLINVDNFIDYQIAVIYAANTDNGNIKFWRERTPSSKWHWILFDFDMAFRRVDHDTVSHVFNPAGTGTGNWFSTTIQMGLLQNDEFRNEFLTRFAYHMNNTFETQRVISLIDELAEEIDPEIARNYNRWTGSYSLWKSCIQKLKDFITARPHYVNMYIQQYFNLTDEQMTGYGFKSQFRGV